MTTNKSIFCHGSDTMQVVKMVVKVVNAPSSFPFTFHKMYTGMKQSLIESSNQFVIQYSMDDIDKLLDDADKICVKEKDPLAYNPSYKSNKKGILDDQVSK